MKLTNLSVQLLAILALGTPFMASAVVETNTDFGRLSLGGDAEINLNASNTNRNNVLGQTSETRDDRWDEDGRLLLNFLGVRELEDGRYGQIQIQPTIGTNGGAGADDAYLGFGQRNNWGMKVGRFEAYDMFPLGQDIFVEHSGDSANDLYVDGNGYVYMLKEGRGRASKGGQLLLNKETGNWYLELSTLIGDRTNLFAGQQYHGYELTKAKDSIMVRPVIAWKGQNLKVALGAEGNVINDAIVTSDDVSVSDRLGYGITTSWTQDALVINASAARMDAEDETDTTLGANLVWYNAGLGYIYAINDITNANLNNTSADFSKMIGKHTINTVYASYKIPSVLDLSNFDIYLGAYWSQLNVDSGEVDNMDRYGGRVRFKYYF
ncbi:carbohydrate porin [Aeromonas veronii]|uniref:carbohydrate porin n=1 Tax=Aeromonas veronii TaxID=654 RepID=UPI0032F068E5